MEDRPLNAFGVSVPTPSAPSTRGAAYPACPLASNPGDAIEWARRWVHQ